MVKMTQWFDVVLLNPDEEIAIYAIHEPGHSEEVISYLILGNEKALLIDTGMGIGNIKAVVEDITSLPVEVVLTHSHFDHTGGTKHFDKIAIHEAEAESLQNGVDNDFLITQIIDNYVWRPFPDGFKPDQYTIPPCTPTVLLNDQDIISIGGYDLEVIHTPGHSPGSICLWNKEKGHLFAGDTIYQGPIYGHLNESDLEQYFSTIKKFSSLFDEVNVIFPGHNKTPLDKSFLQEVIYGFCQIKDGSAEFSQNELFITYEFKSFQVLVSKETQI
ncbi:MAG: MBL fold metallo-hydrolase [Candidatus Heimdallarchaeota archaeon]|nr:MBL fold metallo-hydrolase [Candidatus Heimdallarchaeota archaeon]MCK5048638.1 MBL fold metallo-hydrolase [Candidatus Heimdallarchaeota archaeon]